MTEPRTKERGRPRYQTKTYLELRAERDALLADLRMIAETTPHKQGCDEPDDSFCARCVADSALARAEAGEL